MRRMTSTSAYVDDRVAGRRTCWSRGLTCRPRGITCWSRAVAVVVLLNVLFIVSLYRGRATPATPSPPPPPAPDPPTTPRGTPLLDRLDRVPVHRDAGPAPPPPERCDGWTAGVPDPGMDEPRRWQAVVDDLPETFVFSAFYDRRCVYSTPQAASNRAYASVRKES